MKARRIIGLLVLLACSSIPKIRFDGDAADADTDSSMAPDAADATGDAPIIVTDASDAGCPGTVPPGAVVCCGDIPCGNANCGVVACMDCQLKCAVGSLCCPKPNLTAVCILDASC